jgi:hypothetical protein
VGYGTIVNTTPAIGRIGTRFSRGACKARATCAGCERPGFVIIGGYQVLADFWARYADLNELVILMEVTLEDAISKAGGGFA